MSILVVDVGTSAIRAAVVGPDATVEHEHRRELPPDTPAPGLQLLPGERDTDGFYYALMSPATTGLVRD